MTILGFVVLGLLIASQAEAADPAEPLRIELTAQRVQIDGAGREVLVADDAAAPGDWLQYTAVYRNESERTLRNVVPTLPIPEGTVCTLPTGADAPVAASLDGRNFEPIPLRRPVRSESGEMVLTEVPVSAYRAVRWSPRDIAPGALSTTTLRVRVEADAPKS